MVSAAKEIEVKAAGLISIQLSEFSLVDELATAISIVFQYRLKINLQINSFQTCIKLVTCLSVSHGDEFDYDCLLRFLTCNLVDTAAP